MNLSITASKFAKAIKDKEPGMMDEKTVKELRLAGILHDVGHGPFSHCSETIFRDFEEIRQMIETKPKFSKCNGKPHELISYLIVTSKAFKDYFEDNLYQKKYRTTGIDLNVIGDMIVGDMESPYDAYKSDIINGAFDSDKLDYLARDCYFTGLKMGLDIDRIMYTISVYTDYKEKRTGLVIDISGSPFVEQVLFNKMLLFTSIYHHHKVRALGCMFKSIFEVLKDHNLKMNGRSFDNMIDFLSVTDSEILSLEGKPDEIKPLINNILQRRTLKRALVISKDTIKAPEGFSKEKEEDYVNMKYQSLLELKSEDIRILRDLIVQEVNGIISPYDIWIDIPQPPSLREASQAIIKITNKRLETLNKIFPSSKWLSAYAANKWKGHVFCPPQNRKEINKVAEKIFKEEMDIDFNEDAKILQNLLFQTTEYKYFLLIIE